MEKEMGGENMAAKVPTDKDPSHNFAQPVNPDAEGAAMGAPVLRQDASFKRSTQSRD
jgi:hypothetical protein